MRSAEGVVDVEIGQCRERCGELRVVLSLAGLVADVLEQQDLPALELVRHSCDVVTDDRGRHLHGHSEQLAQPLGDWRQRQLGLALLRPAEVGDQHEARAVTHQLAQRRQRGAHARVIGDPTVPIEWHVEIDAHEHPFAVQLLQVS